jgi:hypothetical protein
MTNHLADPIRLWAHLDLALRWCDLLERIDESSESVRLHIEAVIDAAVQLRGSIGADLIVHEAIENLRLAAEACRSSPETVAELAPLVERLSRLVGPAATMDRLRAAHHELQNRATVLTAQPEVAALFAQAAAVAERVEDEETAEELRRLAAQPSPSPSAARAVLVAARDRVAPAVERARSVLKKLEPHRKWLRRLRRAVIVEDVDEQRARIRHAVELASAEAPFDLIHEAVAVDEADALLEADPEPAEVLLITDLGLPTQAGDSGSWAFTAGRALVERWASRCTTIVVTAHGRKSEDLGDMVTADRDAFLSKRAGWERRLEGIVARKLAPRRFQDAELDVLTFSDTTALLDGIAIRFQPMGFAWLDALADPRPVLPGVERFDPGMPKGHAPVPKTLLELAYSIVMAGSASLPDDTDEWWSRVEKNGRDVYIGDGVHASVRRALQGYSLAWSGDFVVSETDSGERTERQVPWDQWRHRLQVRTVRRWTSASDFLAWRKQGVMKVLAVESDPAYQRALASEVARIFRTPMLLAPDAREAIALAREQRPQAVVLGEPELLPPDFRAELAQVLGPVPMIALTSWDDPSLRSDLLQREGHPDADWRTDRFGRVVHIGLKRGNPDAEAEEAVEILFECVQSLRPPAAHVRHSRDGRRSAALACISIARRGPPGFFENGAWRSLDAPGIAASRSVAVAAHALLIALAEFDNVPLGSRYLQRRLLASGALRMVPGTDYRQLRDRAIGAIRKAIRAPLMECGTAAEDARRHATTILHGSDPYELRGVIELVEQFSAEFAPGDVG